MRQMNDVEVTMLDTLRPLPEDLTYAATVDVRDQECEITELMIRRACEEMDKHQQYPFCSSARKNSVSKIKKRRAS